MQHSYLRGMLCVAMKVFRAGALLPVWGAARRVKDNRVGADYRDPWSNREQRLWRLMVDRHGAHNARGQPGGIGSLVCCNVEACRPLLTFPGVLAFGVRSTPLRLSRSRSISGALVQVGGGILCLRSC